MGQNVNENKAMTKVVIAITMHFEGICDMKTELNYPFKQSRKTNTGKLLFNKI